MTSRYWIVVLVFIVLLPAGGSSDEARSPGERAQFQFRRAAVAPFLVGRREPEMDENMDQTLTCPLGQICVYDPTIAPNAGPALTRLVDDYLRQRFGNRMVEGGVVSDAYGALVLDQTLDSPRSLAMKLGSKLEVDAVFVGTVWRYRDRGAIKDIRDSPASVAFAIYLIETESGRQLWRGLYHVTQHPITDNLFEVKKLWKLGFKWHTAEELARHGVKEAFKDFMPQ